MLSPFWKFFAVGLILIPVSPLLVAVQPRPGRDEPQTYPLIQNSGYIFAGTVKSVERAAPVGNGVATVLINFHVDQAMQGVRSGQMLAIREWAGLWNSGERFRPGERVLLFLYPPSKLGLTSPVGGAMGRFRVDPDGQVGFDPGRFGIRPRHPVAADWLEGRTRVTPRELVRFLHAVDR